MKDQLKEKIRSLVHEVYYGDVKSDKMDADKVIDQALASILALFPKPMDTKFDRKDISIAIISARATLGSVERGGFRENNIQLLIDFAQSYLDGALDRPMMSESELVQFLWDYFKGTKLATLMNGKIDCVDLAHALAGKIPAPEKEEVYPKERCNECGGAGSKLGYGQDKESHEIQCPKCQGAGHIPAKEDKAGHKIDKEGLIIYDDRCAICNPAPEKELERKAIAEILFKTENPKFSHYWQDNIKVKEHEGDCVGIHGECRKCEVEHYFELADAILAHKPAPENICLVCQGTKKNTWDEPCSCGEPKSDVPSEFPPEIEDHPDDEVLNAYNNGQNAMRSECIAVAQKLMADKDTLLEGLRQIVKNYQKWQGEDSLKIAKMTCPYKDIKDGSCIKQVAVDSLCEKLEKAEAEIARLEGK